MKKIFASIFLLLPFAIFAQQLPMLESSEGISIPAIHSMERTTMINDTLNQYFLRANSYVLQTALYGGYAMGTGYFFYIPTSTIQPATTESAMHFSSIGSATVKELLVWFGAVYINGSPDFVTAKIYNAGVDSMPVNPVLGSVSLTSDLITPSFSPSYTIFTFTPGISISSSFMASIAYQNDDTLGIFGNSTFTHDGLGEQRLRQKTTGFLGGNWVRPTQIWANLDADAFIIPVVDVPAGVNEITNEMFSIKQIYPTLAGQSVFLNYELKKDAYVSYRIFDLSGKNVITQEKTKRSAGKYLNSIDISGISDGKYYLQFNADGKSVTQSFVKSN